MLQLNAVYNCIVSIITATRLNILKKKPNYKIQKFLGTPGEPSPLPPAGEEKEKEKGT